MGNLIVNAGVVNARCQTKKIINLFTTDKKLQLSRAWAWLNVFQNPILSPMSMTSVRFKNYALAFLFAVCLALSGCVSVRYFAGGHSFDSPQEALAQIDRELNAILESVPQIDTPLQRNAVVVLPTLQEIKLKSVKSSGSANSSIRTEMVEYVALSLQRNFEFMSKAIVKRGLFEKVDQMKDPLPESAKFDDHDFIIYLKCTSPEVIQWYIKGRGIAAKPLHLDSGQSPGLPRTVAWLEYIEKIAREAEVSEATK